MKNQITIILFKIWCPNRFLKAKSCNFHFHKNDVTWPLSANGLFDKRSKHFFLDDHFFSNPHNLFYDVWILWGEFFSSLLGQRELQFDYYNWGHLDKVIQSDYRKITIRSKKVSCKLPWNEINNTDRNQLITPHTDHTFWTRWRKSVFQFYSEWQRRNVNFSYNFDLR